MTTQIEALLQRNQAATELATIVSKINDSARKSTYPRVDSAGWTMIPTQIYDAITDALDAYENAIAATYPAAFTPQTDNTLDALIATTNTSVERLRADADAWRHAAQSQANSNIALSAQLGNANALNATLTDWIAAVPTEAIASLAAETVLAPTPTLKAVRNWTNHIIESK